MVIFSRFQTELFAYSPWSAASCSVVDSFNLLNAISAFCSSRRSGLVLTLSPQQITAIPKGLGAGVRDSLSAGVRTRDLTLPRPSGTQPQEPGACRGCLGPPWLAPAPGQAGSTWCTPAQEKKNSVAKAATSPSSGLAEVGAQPWALGMERDCRVTPEQGMPVSMEQRSHHSRAPGEHLHKKERHELLLESSRCCSLSPRSWQLHYTADAMEQHRAGSRGGSDASPGDFLPLQMPTESLGSAAAALGWQQSPSTEHTVDSQSPRQPH